MSGYWNPDKLISAEIGISRVLQTGRRRKIDNDNSNYGEEILHVWNVGFFFFLFCFSSRPAQKTLDRVISPQPHAPSCPRCLQCPVPIRYCSLASSHPLVLPRTRPSVIFLFKVLFAFDMVKVSQFPDRNDVHEPVFSNAHIPQYISTVHFCGPW